MLIPATQDEHHSKALILQVVLSKDIEKRDWGLNRMKSLVSNLSNLLFPNNKKDALRGRHRYKDKEIFPKNFKKFCLIS